MNRNVIETVLGAVVLLTAAVFLSFAYGSADLGKKEGYIVRADFERIDGLKAGSDVRMNGVQVGSVVSIVLNKETYRATASFTVDRAIKLPRDTIAMIANESLLGGKYLSLEVGVDDENVGTDGSGKITRTTPPMQLDDLIGHMIFNKEEEKKKEGAAPTPTPTPPPPGPGASLPTPPTPQSLNDAPLVVKPKAPQAAEAQPDVKPPVPLLATEPKKAKPNVYKPPSDQRKASLPGEDPERPENKEEAAPPPAPATEE